jgi:hypothetical protein
MTRYEQKVVKTKAKLLKKLEKYPFIGVVGRVSDWLADYILFPVRCCELKIVWKGKKVSSILGLTQAKGYDLVQVLL